MQRPNETPAWMQARERAHAALMETWRRDDEPHYRFQVSFRGGLRTMSEALDALSGFNIVDVEYHNRGHWQTVCFDCSWSTWESLLKAFESVPADQMQTSVLRLPTDETSIN